MTYIVSDLGKRLKLSTILIATLLVTGCGKADADKPQAQILRVATMKGSVSAMMRESGVLDGAPYRVEWSEFPASQQIVEAIGADAADIGLVGDSPFLYAYQSGSPIKIVAAKAPAKPTPEALAIIVPPQSSIHSVADLAGKSIATTRGSTGHDLILRALEQAGLPPSSVTINFLSPADSRAAFTSGAVDAWSIWVPYLTVSLKDKARIVVDSDRFPQGYLFDAANVTAIKTKHAIIADFLKRETAAFAWVGTHQAQYVTALQKDTGLPLPVAQTIAAKGALLSYLVDKKVIASQRQTYDRLVKAQAIQAKRPMSEAYDTSFNQ